MADPDVVVYTFKDGELVPRDEDLSNQLARPPTRLLTSIAKRYGVNTAYAFVVIWHHAVLSRFRPFNFGRSKYSPFGLGYKGVRSAIQKLTGSGVIDVERGNRRALRITNVRKTMSVADEGNAGPSTT